MPSFPLLRCTPAILLLAACSFAQVTPHYLIANNDRSSGNTASFYHIERNGSIFAVKAVSTGGTGVDGIGAVATKRVSVLHNSTQSCAFVSDAASVDVAGFNVATLTLTGTFKAANTDSAPNGIGVVNNGSFLYASFTGSKTIGTYQIQSGCTLSFIKDVPAAGLSGGAPVDMQVHHNILVVSFQDSSIESFNVSGGVPVSNGDLQTSTGNTQNGSFVAGVDITADGHFALFGSTNVPPLVEVSDISSGKLTPTVVYSNIGNGGGSEAIWLSPDESLLYLSNFSSNQVTAAFFDKTTGSVAFGCSTTMKGTSFEAGLATSRQTGTGGTLFVAEPDVDIGFATVTASAGACTLTEMSNSPVADPHTLTIESIASFPPRPF